VDDGVDLVPSTVSARGTFGSGKNGNVTAFLTLMPPSPPADFCCPPGQTGATVEVSYTNVSITDNANGITEPIPARSRRSCCRTSRGACD
jgi:hypothetical protein